MLPSFYYLLLPEFKELKNRIARLDHSVNNFAKKSPPFGDFFNNQFSFNL